VRDHLPVHWIVDGNNVMGSRPDGWWRDRARAARGLAAQVAAFARDAGEPVTLYFDGRPRDLGLPGDTPLRTRFADRPGRNAADHAIAEHVEAAADPAAIRVVTSDRELAARVQAAGAQVEGAGRFRSRLDAL
jgi:predicted RNA-binding protein with PIN domain